MMGVEMNELFILNIVICVMWFASLDKLGSTFFRKNSTMGKYICLGFYLLAITNIWETGNYMVSAIAQQTLFILFFFMIFRGDRWEKLGFSSVLVSVWELTWNALDSVLSVCNIIFSNNKIVLSNLKNYQRGNGYFITILSFLITTVCIYILFCRTELAEGNFLHGSGKILFSVTSLLLILIDMCNFGITRGIMIVSDNGAEYWNITHNELFTHMEVIVVSILCIVICLSLLFGMNRLIGYITIDNLHKIEIDRYKGILEQYRKQANVRHDLKNHFISLSVLAEHEEWDRLKEYLLKICNVGMVVEEDIETGNNVVNAIVNIKKQVAKQKNIRFDCDINISRPLMIDEYDLCIIWGNILDNAIKAADVSRERYILVQAEIVKRNLLISVKNPIASDINQKDFGMKDWGIGLKNVNKIVQKENGIMNIEIKGTVFDISLMLPIADCPPKRL